MRQINVAIVGAGYWGPNLVRNFASIQEVNVIAVCDLDKERLKKISASFPGIHCTTQYDDILADTTIDLIAIATPISTHFSLAKKALLSKKNVLIEKPMTDTIAQAKELIALAKKQNRQIFVDHTFVFSEAVKKLKSLVSTNELGKIYYFDSSRINLGLIQNSVNVLWDLAPHDFSIIHFLFPQRPIWVQAIGSSYLQETVEELVHVFVQLEDNISIHLQLSWLSPVKIRNITIAGSKKMVTYNDIEPSEKVRIYNKGVTMNQDSITPFSPAYRSGNVIIPHLKQKEALLSELEHIIRCLQKKEKPLAGGNEGLLVTQLIKAAEKSLRSGKRVYIDRNHL